MTWTVYRPGVVIPPTREQDVSSLTKRELAAMRTAGWDVIEEGPWLRLRAVVRMVAHARRRPAGGMPERVALPVIGGGGLGE